MYPPTLLFHGHATSHLHHKTSTLAIFETSTLAWAGSTSIGGFAGHTDPGPGTVDADADAPHENRYHDHFHDHFQPRIRQHPVTSHEINRQE